MTTVRQTLSHYRNKLKIKALRLNCERPFPDYLIPFILGKKDVLVADLGAGPFSLVGTVLDGVKIRVIASDMLADEYNKMISDDGIIQIVPIEKQNMEKLTYADSIFDIVHCVNALDHSCFPKMAIQEMHRICKPDGAIYLRHFPEVGLRHGYRGLHQWNISLNRDCKIWNGTESYSLSKICDGFSNYMVNGMIVSTLVKNGSKYNYPCSE